DANAEQFLVLKTVEDHLRVRSAAAEVGQLPAQVLGGARLVQYQAVEQFVDHPRVVDEDLRKELAPGTKIDIQFQCRFVEAEQLPEDRLGAQRRRHLFQVDQGHVGIGSVGQG